MDRRSSSLGRVNFAQVEYLPWRKTENSNVTGEDKLDRLRQSPLIRLDSRHFEALWCEYLVNKSESVLEWLHCKLSISFICFAGEVFRSPQGERIILSLLRSEENWKWRRWDLSEKLIPELVLRCAVISQ